MPDRDGRIGYEDFAGITNAINTVQAMGQRNTLFQQQQKDRAEAEQLKTDTEANLKGMRDGGQPKAMGDGDVYAVPGEPTAFTPVGTAKSQIEAKRLTAIDTASTHTIAESKDAMEQKELSNIFVGNGITVTDNMKGKFKPANVAMAQAQAADMLIKSEEGRAKHMEVRAQADAKEYSDFIETKRLIDQANAAGDREAASKMISDLTKRMSMPYKYEYDKATDQFNEYYLHSGTGQYEPTNTSLPFKDVMEKINGLTPETFAKESYKFKEATRQWNEKARKPIGDPGEEGKEGGGGKGQHLKKGGQEFYVFPQKQISGTNAVHYIVMDKDNNETTFTSISALHNAGFRYEDLKREKAMADIVNVETNIAQGKQAIAASKATVMGQGVDNQSKTSELYKKNFALLSQPFVRPGTNIEALMNSDTPESKGAVSSAFKFFEANKDKADSLSETDKIKLDSALKIIQLSEQSNVRIGALHKLPTEDAKKVVEPAGNGDQPHIGNSPPPDQPDAKRTKDGQWVVKKDGAWNVVMQKKGTSEQTNTKQPQSAKAMGGASENISSDPKDKDQQISEILPPDPKQWRIRPVEIGLNKFEYIATDINGEDHKLSDAELQAYMEATTPKQGPIVNPAKEIGAAMSGFYKHQKENPLFKR